MRSLTSLIIAAVILGIAIGGAFLGGIAMGKSDSEETSAVSLPTPTVSSARQALDGQGQETARAAASSGEVDFDRLGELRQKLQSGGELTEAETEELTALQAQLRSGGLSAEQLGQFRQQFGGGTGGGGGDAGGGFGGGFARRGGGLQGTITEIAGNTLTVDTAQGPLKATVSSDTTIRLFIDGTLSDLTKGVTVTVNGQPGEDGGVQANSVTVLPEGLTGFGGGAGGFGGAGGRRGGGGGGGGFGGGQ